MIRLARPVLRTTGTVAGQRYVLAVGVHALGLRLPVANRNPRRDPAVVVGSGLSAPDAPADLVAIVRTLADGS